MKNSKSLSSIPANCRSRSSLPDFVGGFTLEAIAPDGRLLVQLAFARRANAVSYANRCGDALPHAVWSIVRRDTTAERCRKERIAKEAKRQANLALYVGRGAAFETDGESPLSSPLSSPLLPPPYRDETGIDRSFGKLAEAVRRISDNSISNN